MRILVADDSGVMRKMIVRTLESIGLTEVVEAADGEKALELFSEIDFDLVLTDWNMPVMDGLQFVQSIRATGSEVPILMVTTIEQRDAIQSAFDAGVNDLLTKPFSAEDLVSKIDLHVTC